MAEENASSAPAPEQKSSSGKNTTLIVIIIVVVLVVLGVGGWLASRYIMGKLAEKATEGIIGGITGSDVDINTGGDGAKITNNDGSFEVSTDKKWPSDIPSEVPKFTDGTIEASSSTTVNDGSGWSISFVKVTSGAYENYRQQLLSAGWTETGTVSTEAKMSTMENDKYNLIFSIDESDATGSLVVTAK